MKEPLDPRDLPCAHKNCLLGGYVNHTNPFAEVHPDIGIVHMVCVRSTWVFHCPRGSLLSLTHRV